MYNYCHRWRFFCIINHGAPKIHSHMSRCLLHLPRAEFPRTELLGSTVHMSRYLIYKECQEDAIKSTPTSTRASLACTSAQIICVQRSVGCVLAREGTCGGQRLTLECLFLLLSTRSFFLQTGSPAEARACYPCSQAGSPASPVSTCRCALP